MPEKRAYKRYNVNLLDITCAIIQAGNIEILDVSLNGIAVHATMRLNIGEQYSLKLQSRHKALSFKGIVIWSKLSAIHKDSSGDTIPVYTAGLEFIDNSQDLGDDIRMFIGTHNCGDDIRKNSDDADEYTIKECPRTYPRFQVNTPPEAFIIDQKQLYQVQELGFGGVRIECTKPLKINNTIPMMLNFSEDKFIVFKGRIVSCRLLHRASPKRYTIGVEFSEMSTTYRKMLSEYIRLLSDIDTSPSR